ncbi:neprilysin-like [Aphidius gifuensis]|uniref:neprilysin-like n=1 Tax=Aphidius gifuensis TaxID=684658 RepID=UPI001CDCF680|nr:neprilysin-like [Aphidius gifuensis]
MSFANSVVFNFLKFIIIGSIYNELLSNCIDNICKSENCKEASRLIFEGLKQDVDPCDDFYEFTCGKWSTSNPIVDDNKQSTRETIGLEIFDRQLLEILESKEYDNSTRSRKIMRQYYSNCMDTDTLDRIGLDPINKIIEKASGRWPIMIDNYIDDKDWHLVDEFYGNLTSSYSLFDIKIVSDYATRSTNKIEIQAPKFPRVDVFPLPQRWNNWKEKKTEYHLFIEKVSKLILKNQNINYSDKDFDEEITKILDFEHALYQASENSYDINFENITIKELQKHYDDSLNKNHKTGSINWLKYFKNIFDPLNINLDDDENVLIMIWKYISRLAKLLNQTDNRTIINYINWKFISTFILFTNEEARILLFDVRDINIDRRLSRQKECLIECRLSHTLFHLYSEIYFPKNYKNNILKISEKLRKQTLDDISKTNWLDGITKSILYDKIETIHMMIGYYDWYDEPQSIENYYAELDPGMTYFDNILNYAKFDKVKNLKQYKLPMTPYEWNIIKPTSFNAMYSYYFNAILFPMVYANSPIFSIDLPLAVKYGSVGFIIGHEFYHALDPHGILYDKNWVEVEWPVLTSDYYKKKINCFENDFNKNITEFDTITNETMIIQSIGNFRKLENMADIAGIKAAYLAYKNETKKNDDVKVIGLENYTSDQLFFISFATKFCHTATFTWWNERYGKNGTEEHSPPRLRINESLRHLKYFSETFNCQPLSPMNSNSRCIVFGNDND